MEEDETQTDDPADHHGCGIKKQTIQRTEDAMKNVEQAVNEFIGCVKDSETYQKYMQERKRLEMFPDLKQRIDEYRKNLYLLQNTEDGDTLFDEVEQLEAEGTSLRDNRLVSDFLAAELAFCRMMQEIYTWITAELEFDMTFSASEY